MRSKKYKMVKRSHFPGLSRMKASKKADMMLMTLSLFMLFAVVAGLGSYWSFKAWKESQKTTLDPQLYIGERQINLFLTANLAEQDLFYLDQSAKFSASESLLKLASKAGHVSENDCGTFAGYNIVKDEEKFCDMDANLDENFRKEMNSVFYKYSIKYSSKLPGEFQYSLISVDDRLNVLGMSSEMMEYNIGKNTKRQTTGETSSLCHYCGNMRNSVPTSQEDDYEKNGFCWKGPCPESALMNGVPLVPYLNQCGKTEISEYEKSCDRDSEGTLCLSGCGIISMNMVLEYFGIPADNWYFFRTEGEEKCFRKDGYPMEMLVEFAATKNIEAVPVTLENPDWDELVKATRDGLVILLQKQIVRDERGDIVEGICTPTNLRERNYCIEGHYIVILYANDDFVIANDPYTGARGARESGHNIVLSRAQLQKAWQLRGNHMIKIQGRKYDPDFDPFRSVLVQNEKDNWVKYFPLDSSSDAHFNVQYLFGEFSCDDTKEFNPGVFLGADEGDNIYAIAQGEVTHAGSASDSDSKYSDHDVIEIDHKNGYYSRYFFSSRIHVTPGDLVMAGERIAEAGVLPGGNSGFYFEIHEQDADNGNVPPEKCITWAIEPVNDVQDPLDFYYDRGIFTPGLDFTEMAIDNGNPSSRKYHTYMATNMA